MIKTGVKNKTAYRKYSIAAIKKDFRMNYGVYMLLLPIVLFYIVFMYMPMYGAVIAFMDYSPALGITGSHWVGLKYFKEFFSSPYFAQVVGNTLIISFYDILFGFPAPIILALLLNEVGCEWYKKVVQTLTYLPYFISVVVICGLIRNFVATDGLINNIVEMFGGKAENLLMKKEAFRSIFVSSNIWQGIGWNSIIYLAALSAVDAELYEAATIDGAGRLRQVFSVTIPSIMPTIVIMLILRIGSVMSVSSDKIILLYNELTYETADVISSFVFRKGITEYNYSFSTAVGLFNSVINFILIVLANKLSRRLSDTSLW